MLERLSANAEHAAPRILDGNDALQGAVVVATCNRFEAYIDLDAPEGVGSGLAHLTAANGLLYFTVSDGTHGDEVWVSNGTAALELALYALGVGPGDEVVTVSHSFIATANAVRRLGATHVFVDIEPATFNIDPERDAAAIGAPTRAILGVHQIGMPFDV